MLLVIIVLTTLPKAAEPVALVVCGWDEVFVLDVAADKPQRLWTWKAKGRTDLPAEFQSLFNSTDDCKPYDGGSKILITSSGGAAALVDRAKDRVLFYGRAANAHSADLLPRGRVAVAASHDNAGKGDRLIVFDLARSNHEVWSEELPWGHGVAWDEQRRVVWALADKDIRAYELHDWETTAPTLHRVSLTPLPESGGHELSVVDRSVLAVSTSDRCWLFDRDPKTFRPHPSLGGLPRVKSISHGPTGRIAYVQAEGDNWWAERIHFLNPAGLIHVAGEHFYKVRWIALDH